MLRHHLLIAFRSLKRQQFYALLNVAGLAIGITCCLLIVLFVQDELSYDRFHPHAERIVRMGITGMLDGQELKGPVTGAPVAKTVKRDFPEVMEAARLIENGNPFVSHGTRTFKETRFAYADNEVFRIFYLPLVAGDTATALAEPNTIVITTEMARKYFGDAPALGQVLELRNDKKSFRVTGVMEPLPANSHFHYDFLATMKSREDPDQDIWVSNNYSTYLLLRPGTDAATLEPKLEALVRTYVAPQLKQFLGQTLEEFRKNGNNFSYFLQPLTSIHLHSNFMGELESNSDIRYVYIFAAIAFFILLIACVNFMNLSTATSARRAKEVGVRKTLGSYRSWLVRQFLTESVLLTVAAVLLAFGLAELLLPFFNQLSGKRLTLDVVHNPLLLPALALMALVVGLLAGSYPAAVLSGFEPVKVLKGNYATGRAGRSIRSGLVVFQFTVSVALMVGTAVVYRQLGYMQQKDAGYDKEQVLVIHDTYTLPSEQVFRQQLLKLPGVRSATVSSFVPAGPGNRNNSVLKPEGEDDRNLALQQWRVDADYIPTLGMQVLKGRNFASDRPADSTAVIINEAAVRQLGWAEPLGRKLIGFGDTPEARISYTIIGVVKDFHYEPLRQPIQPLVLFLKPVGGAVMVKLKTTDLPGTLAQLEQTWKDLKATAPFTYSFMDERFARGYQSEQRAGQLFGSFALLAICTACLGLFGLASFMAQQRTKEIGIRKVMGASVPGIVGLFSKDFLKLVLLSNLLAWPLAYFAMHKWLEDFAYRVSLDWWLFAAAGLLALLIAFLTISWQAIRSALANPVQSLRTE